MRILYSWQKWDWTLLLLIDTNSEWRLQNGTLSIKTHCLCLSLCASSTLTCKRAYQDRIIPCISCPHGAKDWSGFCSHFVHFGRTDFSLCNISSKERTKYRTKQESLPEKLMLLWLFMYKTVRQSSSDSAGIAPGPRKTYRV